MSQPSQYPSKNLRWTLRLAVISVYAVRMNHTSPASTCCSTWCVRSPKEPHTEQHGTSGLLHMQFCPDQKISTLSHILIQPYTRGHWTMKPPCKLTSAETAKLKLSCEVVSLDLRIERSRISRLHTHEQDLWNAALVTLTECTLGLAAGLQSSPLLSSCIIM